MIPIVIIESPYAGALERNTHYARECLLHSLVQDEAPFASHLLYTQVLADAEPEDRELGMAAGFAFYEVAQLCAVYCDRGVSEGMLMGIGKALEHGIPIEFRTLYEQRETVELCRRKVAERYPEQFCVTQPATVTFPADDLGRPVDGET